MDKATQLKVEQLKDAYGVWSAKRKPFKQGDLVTWASPAMKCAKRPATVNEPGIVLEVVPGQKDDKSEVTSNQFGELKDVRVGFVDEDGEMFAWWFDSRRLALFEAK